MGHDLDVANVVDGDNVHFIVVMIADGFVDLPTDATKPVDTHGDCHGVDSFTIRHDQLCTLTTLTTIELLTVSPGSKELRSGSIFGSDRKPTVHALHMVVPTPLSSLTACFTRSAMATSACAS